MTTEVARRQPSQKRGSRIRISFASFDAVVDHPWNESSVKFLETMRESCLARVYDSRTHTERSSWYARRVGPARVPRRSSGVKRCRRGSQRSRLVRAVEGHRARRIARQGAADALLDPGIARRLQTLRDA